MTGDGGTGDAQTPWFVGILCAVLIAVLTAAGLGSFGLALTRINVPFAVVVVAVVVAGAVPALLRHRRRPVLRWLTHGAVAGLAVGVVVMVGSLV